LLVTLGFALHGSLFEFLRGWCVIDVAQIVVVVVVTFGFGFALIWGGR